MESNKCCFFFFFSWLTCMCFLFVKSRLCGSTIQTCKSHNPPTPPKKTLLCLGWNNPRQTHVFSDIYRGCNSTYNDCSGPPCNYLQFVFVGVFFGSCVMWIHHHQTTICIHLRIRFLELVPSVQSVANLRERKSTTENAEARIASSNEWTRIRRCTRLGDFWCLVVLLFLVPTFGFCLESKDKTQESHIKKGWLEVFFFRTKHGEVVLINHSKSLKEQYWQCPYYQWLKEAGEANSLLTVVCLFKRFTRWAP